MKKELKFYICEHCHNVIVKLSDSGVPVVCCGEEMKELKPNTIEASVEKHLPVINRKDNNKIEVRVGSVDHPMEEKHYIEWILLETEVGYRIQHLAPGEHNYVEFLNDEKVIAVYAYCNLHGLWKTSV
ncbi:desulfoferrodoxin family protein [Anaerorhabdus sp.]|jgi:superoxide reductase|uniref:desulfoferrodoxin family protein n=1 Tax=Anaerorhabdus sp. TaxID=1872524 RepID=UPI002FC94AF0